MKVFCGAGNESLKSLSTRSEKSYLRSLGWLSSEIKLIHKYEWTFSE